MSIIKQDFKIKRSDREVLNIFTSKVVWMTGLSGCGKSTIADLLEVKLFEKGIRTYCLDGDNLRAGLCNDLSFSIEDRSENIRRAAEIAKLFLDAGIFVIASFISPIEKDRNEAKKIIGKDDYFEVYINTSIEVCQQRDPKGLYEKVRKGIISNFTGITSPYEIPSQPDLVIDTVELSVEDACNHIMNSVLSV